MGRWTQSECKKIFKLVPRHPAAVTDSQTRREGEPLASTEALMSHCPRASASRFARGNSRCRARRVVRPALHSPSRPPGLSRHPAPRRSSQGLGTARGLTARARIRHSPAEPLPASPPVVVPKHIAALRLRRRRPRPAAVEEVGEQGGRAEGVALWRAGASRRRRGVAARVVWCGVGAGRERGGSGAGVWWRGVVVEVGVRPPPARPRGSSRCSQTGCRPGRGLESRP